MKESCISSLVAGFYIYALPLLLLSGCPSSGSVQPEDVGDVLSSPDGGDVDEEPDVEVVADGATTEDVGIVPWPECQPVFEGTISPKWQAGGTGSKESIGGFGRPDAIFIDVNGILLAGDEDDDYNELHLYDVGSDDPNEDGDFLTPLIDMGTDATDAGDGPLEFRGISGFARDPATGRIYIAEQDNGRIQIVTPDEDSTEAPFYHFHGFMGQVAQNKDYPEDGEFVRLQALRTDSLGNLFVSDDARDNAVTARRDIQVFSPEGEFLYKFGDNSYGPLGWDGNLKEPENFAIDEVRDRVYVCDEGEHELVVFRYSDQAFLERIGGFVGVPNGVDLDHRGNVYVVDEGLNGEGTAIRVLEPDGLDEVYRFGESSPVDDLSIGTFESPDTLLIDKGRDLLVIADQGHDRIQGFALSDIQERGCLRQLILRAPSTAPDDQSYTIQATLLTGEGEIDRGLFEATGKVTATTMGGVLLHEESLVFTNGLGTATLWPDWAGTVVVRVEVGGLSDERVVATTAGPTTEIQGELREDELHWQGVGSTWIVQGELLVPAGKTLQIDAGVRVAFADASGMKVLGSLKVAGTRDEPVQFGPLSPSGSWGQIRKEGAEGEVLLHYVNFTGGGVAADEWDFQNHRHCCTPMLQVHGGRLEILDSVFADSPGKGLLAVGAEVDIQRSAFMRLGFGAEFDSPKVALTSSHFVEMRGHDDNDGLYIWGWGSYGLQEQSISEHWEGVGADGESIEISRCVIAFGDDDGLDTRGSSPIITDSVFYGWADKGVSLSGGKPHLENCLIVKNEIGMKIDWFGRPSSWFDVHEPPHTFGPTLDHVTIATHPGKGLWIDDRGGQDADADIQPTFQEVILWDNGIPLDTDFDPSLISLNLCIASPMEGVTATETIDSPPLFIDVETMEYRLNPTSEAFDLSPGAGSVGWQGFEK